MRAAVYYNNRDIRIEDKEIPKIGPEEILVKVWSSGICGSDVLEWYRLAKAPLVLGHEIAGEIVEVGSLVKEWTVGTRVFVSHHVPCNMCRYCLAGRESVCDTLSKTNFDPGGFSEYLRVPSINVRNGVFRLPDEMSFDQAVFIEPLACVYRGQDRLGWIPARTVLIIGTGIAGLMHVQLAKTTGAAKVIAADINESRRTAALRFGADAAIDPRDDFVQEVANLNGGRFADVVIVATGALSALESALKCVDKGGSILFFAPTDPGIELRLPFNELWRKEVTMTSTYAGSPRDIHQAMELIATGRVQVNDMITHKLPLTETARGFSLVLEASDSMKVIIEPQK
jgi:L-iditol 2-dehydrogenase